MPTYDYVCTRCGHEYELFQKMSDEPQKRCPKCRSKVERKIGSGAGLIFKGSGFYITDYRSDDYKNKAKSDGSESAGSPTKGSSAKSDSGDSSSKSDSGSSSSKSDSAKPAGTKAAKGK